MPKPDDLYTRYMRAARAHESHTASCGSCTPDQQCTVGAPIFEQFARLQDAYLAHQREQNKRR
jgi:hypothetical protein